MLNSLIFDITYRIPERRIVLRDTKYFLTSSETSFEIPNEMIEELISKGFLKKNVYGGVVVINECREFSDTLVKHMRKPNEHHPGKFIDYADVPEPYKGEF